MKMIEVGINDPIYIGVKEQRMPRIKCTKCGKKFWTIPHFDKGICPGCRLEANA